MSGSHLNSIPLPSGNKQEQSLKMSSKDILEKALKGHKSNHMKHTSKDAADGTASAEGKSENSQSIVDELFKDFIAQKMTNKLKKSTADVEPAFSARGSTSMSEMNRLLDMEISSIQAQSKDVSDSQSGDDGKNRKVLKSSSLKQKSHSDTLESQLPSLNDSKEKTTESYLDVKKSSLSSDTVCFSRDKSYQPQTHETVQNQTASVLNEGESKTASEQNEPEEAVVKSTPLIKKPTSNLFSLAKKSGMPIQLGCKLSTQSLNLIQSKDKIDSKGRVWEEGEVQSSSHSEPSDKGDQDASDSDLDNNASETGSIASGDREGKHHSSSKHKKKHKRKHKKKKKKSSSKEKDRGRRKSEDSERKKESSKEQKVKGGDERDRRDDDSGSSSSRHRDKGNHSTDTSSNHHDKKSSSSKDRDERKKSEKHRKRKGDRSRSPKHRKRSKSRSRSRSRSPKKSKKDSSPKRSSARSQYDEYDARYYSDNPPKRDKSHSRSPEKSEKKSSRGKRRRSGDSDSDLRLRIDKAKLRKIAIANALSNLKSGQGPQVDVVTAKSGGKSVEELTDFCKRISEKDKDKNDEVSDSSEEEPGVKSEDDDELPIHHPFKVKDTSSSNIIMNIRNAKQLPILTPSEKQAQQAALRLTFPVSSGSHHRATESEWVPVERTKAVATTTASKATTSQAVIEPPTPKAVEPKVFPDPKATQDIDIGSIISERLQAVRKLQTNPYDVQALSTIHKAQEKVSQWAVSKHLPGQFLGSTGAKVMSQEEIIGDRHHQAWAKKSQFTKAAPVSGGIGLFLLQKMGWKHGEGLGKNNEGNKEPLQLDFKIDRRGLTTPLDNPKAKPQVVNVPRAKDLSNKHPVSALMELCNRRRWGAPAFSVVMEDGPDHKKNFLFKVKVNNVEYQPTVASSNKKSAKAQCAAVCLQEMGLLPRDAPVNY